MVFNFFGSEFIFVPHLFGGSTGGVWRVAPLSGGVWHQAWCVAFRVREFPQLIFPVLPGFFLRIFRFSSLSKVNARIGHLTAIKLSVFIIPACVTLIK